MIATRFALEPIPDRKFGLPFRSYVLFDNRQTGLVLEGTILQRQFETYSGFLLWVTYDEQLGSLFGSPLQIYLLSSAITVLDVRSIVGNPLSSDSLTNLFKSGDDVFQFTFRHRWQLSVLKTPRFHLIRRAYEWGESGASSLHHTAFFAYRYLELKRLRL